MTENQQKVIGQTLMQFSADATVTEEALINCVNVFSMISPLTDAEKEEQKQLRSAYVANVRANLKGQLDNISIVEKDGSITDLGKKHGKGSK